mgnify:CR=1 FL=1
MIEPACKTCKEHTENCHASCSKYIAYKMVLKGDEEAKELDRMVENAWWSLCNKKHIDLQKRKGRAKRKG